MARISRVPRTATTHRQRDAEPFRFDSLRSDWYAANTALPRAIRQTVEGTRRRSFIGFPRHWLPVFECYGVPWAASIEPRSYVPFFSDLSEQQLVDIMERSRVSGRLRVLAESASVYDSTVSDCIYIVDNTVSYSRQEGQNESGIGGGHGLGEETLLLNSWQAYGLPSVRAIELKALAVKPSSPIAAVLPCARTRPYHRSRTHRGIYARLEDAGHRLDSVHLIVVTALGVLPQELWSEPAVLAYDAGVPDIYRTLRLARAYFSKNRYDTVLDCLQFAPYSDVLRIVQREGGFADLIRLHVPGRVGYHVRA